jgi:hypothetical protein
MQGPHAKPRPPACRPAPCRKLASSHPEWQQQLATMLPEEVAVCMRYGSDTLGRLRWLAEEGLQGGVSLVDFTVRDPHLFSQVYPSADRRAMALLMLQRSAAEAGPAAGAAASAAAAAAAGDGTEQGAELRRESQACRPPLCACGGVGGAAVGSERRVPHRWLWVLTCSERIWGHPLL